MNVTTTEASGLDSSRHRSAGSWEPVKRAPKPLIVGYSEALAWNFPGLAAPASSSHVATVSAPAPIPGPAGVRNPQYAQRNYERYLALARAEALTGDRIAAENYFQHAEHYFRSMH